MDIPEFINVITGNHQLFNAIENEKICKNCNNNEFSESDGYIICINCGTVNCQRISETAEWSNYLDSSGCGNGISSRCGSITKSTDINPFISEYSCFVQKGVKNIRYEDGKQMKFDISKLHVKNNFNHLQKSFNNVESILDNITNDKYSKRIVSTAKMLWSEIMISKKITRAGVRKGLIACCLYYACIHFNSTRSPIEICKDFGMDDTKQFNKGDKEFKETFENVPKWSHLLIKTSQSDDYFGRFCSDLEVNHLIKEGVAFKLANECRELYNKVKDKLVNIFSKNIACGILYWIIIHKNMNITKNGLSKTLKICVPSLQKNYNLVCEVLGNPEI